MARGLVEAGFVVDIAITNAAEGRDIAHAQSLARAVWVLPLMVPCGLAANALASLTHDARYDVVYVSNSREGFDAIPAITRMPRPPIIIAHIHAEEGLGAGYPAYAGAMYADAIDCFIVHSAGAKALVVGYGAAETRTRILPVPVDTHRIRLAANNMARGLPSPDNVRILFAGRLETEKAPLRALDTVNLLRAAGIPATMKVAGDGSLAPDVRQFVHRSASLSDAVEILGHVDDLAPIYESSDVLLLSSDREGTPLVIAEALTFGLPVVAPDVGSIGELIGGRMGRLAAAPSATALADATSELLSDPAIWTPAAYADRVAAGRRHSHSLVGLQLAGEIESMKRERRP